MSLYSIPNLTANVRRIAVLNWKGGCGKSLIATNLASYYAVNGYRTAIVDHDPQGSSLRWLNQRPKNKAAIHGINATMPASQITRSFNMRLPPGTERVVIDTPAGIRGYELQEMVRQTDYILIPVLPSDTDIHSAANFIGELLLDARVRDSGARVAVIANRVRQNTLIFEALKRFLRQIQFPLICTLRDTQQYIHATQKGIGVHEIQPRAQIKTDLQQWDDIIEWIEHSEIDTYNLDLNLA